MDAAAAEQTLTRADAAEMQQADAAVTALTEGEQYQEMDTDARKDAALAQLDTLAAKGLVERDGQFPVPLRRAGRHPAHGTRG